MIQSKVIQPRIVIVDDNIKICRSIKRNLNVVNRTNGHCLLPDYEIVNTFQEFINLMEQTPREDNYFSSVIVDINLGNDGNEDGLKILEFIQNHYPQSIHAFVYSAYQNYKAKCAKLGVDSDSFMLKHDGTLLDDIKNIKQKIEGKFLSKIKDGVINKFDLLILKSTSNRHFQFANISISDSDFANIGSSERMLLFQFFTHRIKPGLNIFSQSNRLWHFEVREKNSLTKGSSAIVQIINPDYDLVEGLQIQTKEKSWYINLGDLETLEKSQDTLFSYSTKADNFENRLAEFFFTKRLVDLYEVLANRKTIVPIAKRIHHKENKLAFLFGIWEFIAKNRRKEENEAESHKDFLETFNEKTFQQFFYCEIEEIDEQGAVPSASVRFQDVADESISFYREFPLDFLNKHGVCNINDRFKMIFFSDSDSGLIGSHAIVPLPPNVKI